MRSAAGAVHDQRVKSYETQSKDRGKQSRNAHREICGGKKVGCEDSDSCHQSPCVVSKLFGLTTPFLNCDIACQYALRRSMKAFGTAPGLFA